MSYRGWAPYVPVAKRRAKAAREMKKLLKKGMKIEPVEVQGRKIARTFWGEAWCNHLENSVIMRIAYPGGEPMFGTARFVIWPSQRGKLRPSSAVRRSIESISASPRSLQTNGKTYVNSARARLAPC